MRRLLREAVAVVEVGLNQVYHAPEEAVNAAIATRPLELQGAVHGLVVVRCVHVRVKLLPARITSTGRIIALEHEE